MIRCPGLVSSSVLSLGLLSACATQTVMLKVPRAAQVDLRNYGPVAVMEFAGEGGVDLGNDITAELSTAERFQLVDRRNMEKVLGEIERQRGELFDVDTAARVGKLTGAAVLVDGKVSRYQYREEPLATQELPITSDGQPMVLFTRSGTATVDAYVQVTQVETGQILLGEAFAENMKEQRQALNKEPQPIDGDLVLLKARKKVAKEFRLKVAPYVQQVAVPLFKDGSLPELSRGNAYVQMGDWSRAFEEYRGAEEALAARQAVDVQYKVLYNQAVLLTCMNRFEEARPKLTDAFAQFESTAPWYTFPFLRRSMFTKQLAFLDERAREFGKLKEQTGGGAGPGAPAGTPPSPPAVPPPPPSPIPSRPAAEGSAPPAPGGPGAGPPGTSSRVVPPRGTGAPPGPAVTPLPPPAVAGKPPGAPEAPAGGSPAVAPPW